MIEVINKYETIMIVDLSKSEEEVNAIVDKFKSLIEANGTIENVDVWGRRRLAYTINDMPEGYYVLIKFSAKTDFPAELDRVYGITNGIMRHIIVKRDEKEEARIAQREAAKAAKAAARAAEFKKREDANKAAAKAVAKPENKPVAKAEVKADA